VSDEEQKSDLRDRLEGSEGVPIHAKGPNRIGMSPKYVDSELWSPGQELCQLGCKTLGCPYFRESESNLRRIVYLICCTFHLINSNFPATIKI